MAEYLFTGAYPRIMFGLSQAVNAWHHPADGNPSQLAVGQTIVLEPGDSVRIDDEDYSHAELVQSTEETQTQPERPARRAAKSTKE